MFTLTAITFGQEMSVCSERCSQFLDESPDPVSPAGACLMLYSL